MSSPLPPLTIKKPSSALSVSVEINEVVADSSVDRNSAVSFIVGVGNGIVAVARARFESDVLEPSLIIIHAERHIANAAAHID